MVHLFAFIYAAVAVSVASTLAVPVARQSNPLDVRDMSTLFDSRPPVTAKIVGRGAPAIQNDPATFDTQGVTPQSSSSPALFDDGGPVGKVVKASTGRNQAALAEARGRMMAGTPLTDDEVKSGVKRALVAHVGGKARKVNIDRARTGTLPYLRTANT